MASAAQREKVPIERTFRTPSTRRTCTSSGFAEWPAATARRTDASRNQRLSGRDHVGDRAAIERGACTIRHTEAQWTEASRLTYLQRSGQTVRCA